MSDEDKTWDEAGLALPADGRNLEESAEVTEAFAQMQAAERGEVGAKFRYTPKQVGITLVVIAIAPFVALLAFQYLG